MFYQENFFFPGSKQCIKEGSGKGHLCIGAPLGDLEGRFAYPGTSRDSKSGRWKQSVFLYEGSARGPWREGSFTGNPKGYVKKGSGNGRLYP